MNIEIPYTAGGYFICIKPAGIESEHELTELLSKQTGKKVLCVHRLDKNVSGLMVFAFTKDCAAKLTESMTEGLFEKTYAAVVSGKPEADTGIMKDYLFHDVRRNKTFIAEKLRKGVKEAQLEYTLEDTSETAEGVLSLVKIRLHTGRSHQIRVQFASRRMPIAGDRTYGSKIKCAHPALVSVGLSFPDPGTGETVLFSIPLPEEYPWNIYRQ